MALPVDEQLQQRIKDYSRAISRRKYLDHFIPYAREPLEYDKLIDGYPHLEVSNFLDRRPPLGKPFKLLLMPRGSLKTSLIIAKIMHRSEHDPNIRVLYDSATYAVAVKNVTAMRDHWERNEKYARIFGQKGFKGGPTTWNEDECTIITRTRRGLREPTISASGVDAPRNSLHYDLIVADDLHNELNSKTAEQVNKVIEHFSLLFALLNPGGELWVIGTRWGINDLYGHILNKLKEEFDIYVKSAYEPDGSKHGKLLLPSILSESELSMRKKILDASDISLFDGQYLNEPISRAGAPFKAEHAVFFDYDHQIPEGCSISMTIDPATSKKATADYSAICIVGKDDRNELWDIHHWQDKVDSKELVDKIFELVSKYNPQMIGMEEGALKNTIEPWLNDEMRKRNIFFYVEPLKGWKDSPSKEARVRRLEAYWKSGAINLRRGFSDLYEQFIGFPHTKHDDLIDAFAFSLELLNPGEAPQEIKKTRKDRFGNDIILTDREQQVWENVNKEAERLEKIRSGENESEDPLTDSVGFDYDQEP